MKKSSIHHVLHLTQLKFYSDLLYLFYLVSMALKINQLCVQTKQIT